MIRRKLIGRKLIGASTWLVMGGKGVVVVIISPQCKWARKTDSTFSGFDRFDRQARLVVIAGPGMKEQPSQPAVNCFLRTD